MLSKMSDRERQILYELIYICDLKKLKQRVEQQLPDWVKDEGNEEMLVKGCKLPVTRGIHSGDLMYIMLTIVNYMF